jgi:hypothetical protein
MTAARVTTLAILACALGSCATAVPYLPHDRPSFILSIWLEKKSLLNPADVLAACSEWRAKGVVCRLVVTRTEADVAVEVDETPCDIDADMNVVLARAWREGRIEFIADCFGRRGDYNRAKFRAVLTHELGHVIGIWEHVPKKCRGAPKHPSGRPVCGIAVMNSHYDDDVDFITVVDGMAFDLRDRKESRLKPLAPPPASMPTKAGETPPSCVYIGKR